MDELTPEQKKNLKTWAFQRDALLRDIETLTVEKEALVKTNNNLASSNTDIQSQILRAEGRLEEINKKEEERKNLLTTEVSDLTAEKGKLQSELPALAKEIGSLTIRKNSIVENIDTLVKIHEKVFEKVGTMESAIGHVKDVSDKNLVAIGELFKKLTDGLTDLFEKSKQSNAGADVILEKLPRWIFELQRPISLKKLRPERLVDRTLPDETSKETK